jgi:hypothetical protein
MLGDEGLVRVMDGEVERDGGVGVGGVDDGEVDVATGPLVVLGLDGDYGGEFVVFEQLRQRTT